MSATASPGASPPTGASAFISQNRPTRPAVQRFRVQFTASGRTYFRIWLVNLLLTLATLGLYYPWARARQLRYFYRHTSVASHALDFDGEPLKMLRGHVLTLAMLLACMAASQVSRTAGLAAAMLLAASWPALYQASTRFRLSHTRWRGQNFGFTGRLQDAYVAFASPFAALACLVLLGRALWPALVGIEGNLAPATQVLMGTLICLVLTALMPLAYWRAKRFQHDNRVYARLRPDCRVRYRDVLQLFVNAAMVATWSALVAMAIGVALFMLAMWSRPDSIHPTDPAKSAWQAMPMWLGLVVLSQAVPAVYFKAHAQNLFWTCTGNRWMRFRSELAFKPLLQLSIRNWTLTALTLGLYWPFASVAITRMRLQAVCVHMRTSPELLVAQAAHEG